MPGDLSEPLLRHMLTESLHCPVSSVAVIGVDHDVTDGNGYTSDMSRLRAKVVTADGRGREVSLLVKQCILDHVDNDILKDAAELTTEIKVYKDILPAMEQLISRLETAGADSPALWPHCIGSCNNSLLVLEDLKELGYTTCDRIRGLDFPHARVAVRGLARFHAASAELTRSGLLNPRDFDKFIFAGGSSAINGFVVSSFEYLYSVAKKEWSPEWKEVIENVGKIPGMAVDKMSEITRLDEDFSFKALNHGDPWVNNMMFRHTPDGQPDSIRLVDFQLSHYNSCTFDLHYFLNTSLSTEVLPHSERLLEEYHTALTEEHCRLGLEPPASFSSLQEELQQTEFFGLFSAVCIAPVITADPSLAPLKENKEGLSLADLEARKVERFRSREFTRRIQIILRRAQHGGLFKRIFI